MNAFVQELKISVESLRRRPGFVATVVITLGITLGALITFFNLNHVLLVKPLPYPDQDRLYITEHAAITQRGTRSVGAPFVPGLLHTYENQQSFDSMTILSTGSEFLVSHPEQPRMAVTFTTPEYFEILAAPMHLGRTFSAGEGLDRDAPVAVISYQSWQRLFQADESVIGQKIQLRETSYTVIGVTAGNFHEPEIANQGSDVWLPWDFNGMNEMLLTGWNNGQGNIAGLGKLKVGQPRLREESSLSSSLDQAYQDHLASVDNPGEMSTHMGVMLQPLKTRLLGDSQLRGLLLMGAVFALLLIASTNVINLFYSRAAEKQRTFAIQAALGARKKHLFKAMFAESLTLTVLSGLAGLLVASWGIDLVKELGKGQFGRLDELGLDITAVVFTAAMAGILAWVFSTLSSRVVNYDALQEQLQSSGKGAGLQISRNSRNILVISQITLASLLLAGASLVLGRAYSVISEPLGFDVAPLSSFTLDARAGLVPQDEAEARQQQVVEIESKLRQLPQVSAVSPSFNTPIGFNMTMGLVDQDNSKRGEFPTNFVSANYFQTLGLPVLEGRMFSADEVRSGAQVVVLSRSAAEQAGHGQSVLGLKVTVGGGDFKTVVGVVEDTYDPTRRGDLQNRDIYLPHAPWNMHFVMRTKDGAQLTRNQLIEQLQSIDSRLRVSSYRGLEERHNEVTRQDKITASVAAAVSALALLLAGAGIYGVLSYSSHMRRYELGIRMALGAKSRQITALVIKDNMAPIVTGIAISILVGLTIYVFARQHLTAFAELSLFPLVAILPIILLTALTASYIPVRNVIHKDPVKALRNE